MHSTHLKKLILERTMPLHCIVLSSLPTWAQLSSSMPRTYRRKIQNFLHMLGVVITSVHPPEGAQLVLAAV
jgi:hypothetical protein